MLEIRNLNGQKFSLFYSDNGAGIPKELLENGTSGE